MVNSKLFSVIGIYQPSDTSINKIPVINPSGYLHLHIIEHRLIQDYHFLEGHGKAGVLYQWGNINQKNTKTRREMVNRIECTYFGQIGIGSVASGEEQNGSFEGGGEGFILGNKGYRVIMGNRAIALKPDDNFWIVQITAFKNKIISNLITEAKSRNDLALQCINFLGGREQVFVINFNARFDLRYLYSRSNGIFATDQINDPYKGVFFGNEIQGGHLIGDSNIQGDKDHSECEYAKVILKIDGPMSIEPIDEIFEIC